MSARVLLVTAIACCLIVLTTGGCSKSADEVKAVRATHGSGQGATGAAPRASAVKRIVAVPGDNELVSAVDNGNAPSADESLYDLRFRLQARPQVAQPLQIEIVAVPAADTQFVRLQLSVLPGDGISLSGESTFDDRDMPTGARVRHTITAVPAQPGVLQLYVSAIAVTDKTSITRQFAIPLIAFGAQPAASTGR